MRNHLPKRLVTLAALAVLAIVGLPGAAAAKPELSTLSGLTDACTTQLAAAAAVTVTAEEDGLAPCVDVDPGTPSTMAVNDPNCPKWGWFVTRFRACTVTDWVLSVYTVKARELKGRMTYSVRDEVKTTGRWSAVRDSQITGDGYGTGDCRALDASMPFQPFPTQFPSPKSGRFTPSATA